MRRPIHSDFEFDARQVMSLAVSSLEKVRGEEWMQGRIHALEKAQQALLARQADQRRILNLLQQQAKSQRRALAQQCREAVQRQRLMLQQIRRTSQP